MNPDSKALGRWVKDRRTQLDLTLDELAASAKCSKGYIDKLENAALHSSARRPPHPTLEFLYKLSRALGTSIAAPLAALGYLKNKPEANMETSAAHPIRILHYYNQLSKEDQAIAEDMVKALWVRRKRPEPAKLKAKPQKTKTA